MQRCQREDWERLYAARAVGLASDARATDEILHLARRACTMERDDPIMIAEAVARMIAAPTAHPDDTIWRRLDADGQARLLRMVASNPRTVQHMLALLLPIANALTRDQQRLLLAAITGEPLGELVETLAADWFDLDPIVRQALLDALRTNANAVRRALRSLLPIRGR